MTLTLRQFNATTLGALIALFERAVGFYGELVDINAYHQPGVEAGKKAAAAILELQKKVEQLLADGQTRTVQQISEALGDPSHQEAVFFILRHLSGNPRGVEAVGDWADPLSLQFRKV